MKRLFLILTLSWWLLLPQSAFCGIVEEVTGKQIAVEKLTGRGEEYGLNFSGWVGSLTIDVERQLIVISEFSDFEEDIAVVNGIYGLREVRTSDRSIDFECYDTNVLTAGMEWRGKIWLTDAGSVKVEIVQKQSPRRWVNLSDQYGRKFLKEHGISKLFLGI